MALCLKDLLFKVIRTENNWKFTLLYNWRDIIGNLHNKVIIEKIHDDTIVLGVIHSSWMQELHLLSPLIIKTINEKLEEPYIKQIRFKHITNKKTKTKKAKETVTFNQNVTLNEQDKRVLEKINDPILREALKAFRIRCYREL